MPHSGRPSPLHSTNFRNTVVCKFFVQGKCRRGQACTFAHSSEELRTKPDLSCTRVCRMLVELGFCDDADCRYAHCKEELRDTPDPAGKRVFEAHTRVAKSQNRQLSMCDSFRARRPSQGNIQAVPFPTAPSSLPSTPILRPAAASVTHAVPVITALPTMLVAMQPFLFSATTTFSPCRPPTRDDCSMELEIDCSPSVVDSDTTNEVTGGSGVQKTLSSQSAPPLRASPHCPLQRTVKNTFIDVEDENAGRIRLAARAFKSEPVARRTSSRSCSSDDDDESVQGDDGRCADLRSGGR
eukprot:TRINITY_DN49141_c0_g1_i1.p1 TRINITY_DN49141_c0_g1~~TRINITY_DN49141_c0_g1_i1.p1  ORF type:complete len:297 (-),score=53.15 TRINITY_DN49141_c0_g1_i1:554-1444(-)